MDSIFMNFENCKKFGSHSPLLNVSDKMNLMRTYKYVALSNLRIYFTWKNIT